MLAPAAHAALGHAEQLLQRLSLAGTLPRPLGTLHTRFGTPSRALDVAAASTILVMLASGGRATWLARAYAIGIAATLALKIAAGLFASGGSRPGTRPFRAPLNLHVGTRGRSSIGTSGSRPAHRSQRIGDDGQRRYTVHRDGRAPRRSHSSIHRHWPRRLGRLRLLWSLTRSIFCRPPSSRSATSTRGLATCWCPSAIRTR